MVDQRSHRSRRGAIKLIASVGTAGLTGCLGTESLGSGTDYSTATIQAGYHTRGASNARTGAVPDSSPITDEPNTTYTIDNGGNLTPALVVNGRLYTNAGLEQMGAYDSDGTQIWSHDLENELGYSGYAVGSDQVFVPTISASAPQLVALDATTGAPQWRLPYEERFYSPIVTEDLLILTHQNGTVRAVSTDSGETVWTRSFEAGRLSLPILTDGVLYQRRGTTVYALDPRSGTTQSTTPLPSERDALAVAPDGTLLVPKPSNEIQAVDSSGTEEWTIGNADDSDQPAIHNGSVYVQTGQGSLAAHDFGTGDRQWIAKEAMVSRQATVVGDYVYTSGFNRWLYCVDAQTGELVWKHYLPAVPDGSPTVSNGRLYVTLGGRGYPNTVYVIEGE